jgi:hypothetical protein
LFGTLHRSIAEAVMIERTLRTNNFAAGLSQHLDAFSPQPFNSAMPTDQQISILVDIVSSSGAGLPRERLTDLMYLVAAGFVEGSDEVGTPYKLTAKGQRVLDDPGSRG